MIVRLYVRWYACASAGGVHTEYKYMIKVPLHQVHDSEPNEFCYKQNDEPYDLICGKIEKEAATGQSVLETMFSPYTFISFTCDAN